MAILIIRHGETAGNANRVIQLPDTPLSERGLAQAARLGARLESSAVRGILASDYARARMTAERVAAATGLPIESEPLLRERNLGDLRGTSYDDLGLDPFAPGYTPPAGESWEVFHARVDDAWSRIRAVAAATEGDLAVVTHGLVIYSLILRHLELPSGLTPTPGFGNTSVTVTDPAPPWRIRLLNCTAHLDADSDDPGSAPA